MKIFHFSKLAFIILFLFGDTLYAQAETTLVKAKVDKRVELLSIVFRLADCEEYSQNKYPKYINKIESPFNSICKKYS